MYNLLHIHTKYHILKLFFNFFGVLWPSPRSTTLSDMHHSQMEKWFVCRVPRTTSVPALSTKSMALWCGFSFHRCRTSSRLSMAQGRSTRLTLVFSNPPCTEGAGLQCGEKAKDEGHKHQAKRTRRRQHVKGKGNGNGQRAEDGRAGRWQRRQ